MATGGSGATGGYRSLGQKRESEAGGAGSPISDVPLSSYYGVSEYDEHGHGHFFSKKTFHKPTYCHHCTDMLWGLIQQGCICEVCNFVVHDRCLKTVVSPCSTVASNVIKNPVPHCWTESGHLKRKFCSVCRRRIEADASAVRCEVCEYCVHFECQDFSVANCKECATWVPDSDAAASGGDSAAAPTPHQPSLSHHHHWREGNLPPNSKCHQCKKTCWSAECLAGMRCEWCGWTAHPACVKNLNPDCNFGCLQSIMLPPYCVSIPRTDVPLETILGFQLKRKGESAVSGMHTPKNTISHTPADLSS